MSTGLADGVDGARLAAVCSRCGNSRLELFGSVACRAATPVNDVDLLSTLRPAARLGWEVEALADELAEIVGRPVDPVSRTALHPLLTATVLDEARPIYAA